MALRCTVASSSDCPPDRNLEKSISTRQGINNLFYKATYSNAGNGWWHGSAKNGDCRNGNIFGRVLLRAVSAWYDHVGLEERAFKEDMMIIQRLYA